MVKNNQFKRAKRLIIKHKWWLMSVLLFCAFLIWLFIPSEDINYNTYGNLDNIGDSNIENSELNSNYTELLFYDNKTGCELNGKIYVGDKLVGESKEGSFLLSKTDYDNSWNQEIKIKGLTDSCFDRNKNLPFVEYWTILDLDYYFENDEPLEFNTELNPRWPVYPEAMQGFIRPYEVAEKLSTIMLNENDSDLKNLNKLFGHTYMNYVSDSGQFGEPEYWQTPQNFIENKGGDCEDWAIYTVSLIRMYNPDLDCYAASWLTHMNVLCVVENKFIILDQEKVQKNFAVSNKLNIQENQINARSWRNEYFEEYGIRPDERRLSYLFNEEELIEFENGQEDFIDWVLNRGLSFYEQ